MALVNFNKFSMGKKVYVTEKKIRYSAKGFQLMTLNWNYIN